VATHGKAGLSILSAVLAANNFYQRYILGHRRQRRRRKMFNPTIMELTKQNRDLSQVLTDMVNLIEFNGLGNRGDGKPYPYEPTTEGLMLMRAKALLRKDG
jgi:hypothetical protein